MRGTAVGGPVTVEYEYTVHGKGLDSMRMSMYRRNEEHKSKDTSTTQGSN